MSGDLLAGAGLVVAGLASAVVLTAAPGRLRSGAMAAALLLAPLLVLGDQWDSSLISDLRDTPARLLALAGASTVAVALLYAVFRRWPEWLPLAIVAALPFRIPLHAGGDQANLLIPLYVVIVAGVALIGIRDWKARAAAVGGAVVPAGGTEWGDQSEERPHRRAGGPHSVTGPASLGQWVPRILALFVVLYTLQALYSDDFSKGLQNVCFFLVPFSLVFAVLANVRWSLRLLTAALVVMAVEGLVFSLVGFVEYATRDLLWNDAVMRSNQFHVYFRVNSLFWDPNIFGRYLAIVIVLLVAALLWAREQRVALALAGFSLVLWLGMATTFSQSSYAALVAGLATLAALRWSLRWTVIACAVGAVATLAIAVAAGSSLKLDLSTDNKVNKETTGRFNLASGGLDLFADRPIWGYGSGSFSTAFRKHVADAKPPVSESHTEPITVAAEQGLIGLAAYIALLIAAFAMFCSGMRATMPGLQRGPPGNGTVGFVSVARAAVLAAFVALLVHTMAYAAFFEDPITWVLLAVGGSLAALDVQRGEAAPPAGAAAPNPVRAPV